MVSSRPWSLGPFLTRLGVATVLAAAEAVSVIASPRPLPKAELVPAVLTRLNTVDSNSPSVWVAGRGRLRRFVLFTSVGGAPVRQTGRNLTQLGAPNPVTFEPAPLGGAWMEAVLADVDGTLYGYYHNEVMSEECPGRNKVLPRIGAARSEDGGATWVNLGTILAAPAGDVNCATANTYFVGGVGDLSVVRDDGGVNAYVFYSSYVTDTAHQGVGVARLLWADRDDPVGKTETWRDGAWLPATADDDPVTGETRWTYPEPTPLYGVSRSWHASGTVAGFWGPAVHWNSYLQQWVMLLNLARDAKFASQGIYIAYAPTLDDPQQWSAPQRLLDGGSWYPQVIGTEPGTGTDKVAGQVAPFFMSGESRYNLQFTRPGDVASDPGPLKRGGTIDP